MTTTVTEPRAWIGCPACYNGGRLVGHWYGITEADEVDLASVHRGSGVGWKRAGCEELWSPPGCAPVATLAEGNSDLPSLSDFEDRYRGCWPSFRDYAVELAEDLCLFEGIDGDRDVVRYFDWDSWIRDLEMSCTVVDAPDCSIYVFANR
ncbi:MAG: antirestriction protein ArdA [Gordonia sp. (in: high G+C Gram-positive bacteria)]|uniref:antirestriction protein ArdA n=1 Tax=Gordonia sp. (in: high G+C Gram-positive bacteria) TaxID=84139 RepID=UPI0039E5F3FB